jgi:hypothetical protein
MIFQLTMVLVSLGVGHNLLWIYFILYSISKKLQKKDCESRTIRLYFWHLDNLGDLTTNILCIG